METDGEAPTVALTTCSLPEAEAYVALLVITYLIDQKQYQEVRSGSTPLGSTPGHKARSLPDAHHWPSNIDSPGEHGPHMQCTTKAC